MKPRTRKTSPKRKSPAPKATPRSPVDAALLQSMALRVPTRKGETTPLTALEIERALISGEHALVIKTYFGESEHAELTARAARRTRRGGRRVLILPGNLGSTLALKKGSKLDTIWFDFGDIVRGRMAQLPSLVFFNACESARVRTKLKKTPHTTKSLRERIERSVGVAEAFLRGGIANYLGTYWPVGDAPAEKFATVFYNSLLAGEAVGHSVQKARAEVDRLKSPDWADYLQYGSFEFTLKRTDS